jgi:hypothetical protein
MTYKEKAQEIYNLMFQGKLLEAFDTYYADNVVMQELGEEPRVGKAINREYEIKFLDSIQEIHGGGVSAIASDEANKVVFIENWLDVTFKSGMRINMAQVCVQTWEGEHIVKETFYHK